MDGVEVDSCKAFVAFLLGGGYKQVELSGIFGSLSGSDVDEG